MNSWLSDIEEHTSDLEIFQIWLEIIQPEQQKKTKKQNKKKNQKNPKQIKITV